MTTPREREILSNKVHMSDVERNVRSLLRGEVMMTSEYLTPLVPPHSWIYLIQPNDTPVPLGIVFKQWPMDTRLTFIFEISKKTVDVHQMQVMSPDGLLVQALFVPERKFFVTLLKEFKGLCVGNL